MAAILAVSAGVIGAATYFVGLWDNAGFSLQETLLPDEGEKEPTSPLYAIVATCREKNIGRHVMRLMQGVKTGFDAVPEAGLLATRAKDAYWKDCCTYLSVGLYFDNPSKVQNPRWAIGWAVQTEPGGKFEDVQALVEQIQMACGLAEEIRAVRLGNGPMLKGRIPWRHMLTPMVAPMLHWGRALNLCYKNNYHANNGRTSGQDAYACLELYLMSTKGKPSFIDYVVLLGDTTNVWNDTFPEE